MPTLFCVQNWQENALNAPIISYKRVIFIVKHYPPHNVCQCNQKPIDLQQKNWNGRPFFFPNRALLYVCKSCVVTHPNVLHSPNINIMKKTLLTIALSCICFAGFSQSKTACCTTDENEELKVITDKDFNTSGVAFIGNDNEFIGSYAGIDMNNASFSDGTINIVYPNNAQELQIKDINGKHENFTIPAKQNGVVEINGTKYHMIIKVLLPQDHQFTSLPSIAKEQGIETKNDKVLYMTQVSDLEKNLNLCGNLAVCQTYN